MGIIFRGNHNAIRQWRFDAIIRDGEWLQATSNIALSIALCVVAVTAGHFAAAALNQMEAP